VFTVAVDGLFVSLQVLHVARKIVKEVVDIEIRDVHPWFELRGDGRI
jgi:hypothetical protein